MRVNSHRSEAGHRALARFALGFVALVIGVVLLFLLSRWLLPAFPFQLS